MSDLAVATIVAKKFLSLARVLALGKPVIATGYSGNLEFMDDTNSFLVPYQLTAVPAGCCYPYPEGALWADADRAAAAELMRQAYYQPGLAAAKGARARADMADKHSPEQRLSFLWQRLRQIHGAGEDGPAGSPTHRQFTGREQEAVATGAPVETRLGHPDARLPHAWPRRLLARLARPWRRLNHQPDRAQAGGATAKSASAAQWEERTVALEARLRQLEARLRQTGATIPGATPAPRANPAEESSAARESARES